MSERAKVQCVMASADYRGIAAIEDKVRYLRSHNFTYGVISAATGVHLSRVKRFLGKVTTTSTRSRKPLLSEEQDKELLEVIRKRAEEHRPMTIPDVQEWASE